MEKAIDFCFRTGGTAGSVVTTQIATGVAFMAPSAIRCDRLAERDSNRQKHTAKQISTHIRKADCAVGRNRQKKKQKKKKNQKKEKEKEKNTPLSLIPNHSSIGD